MSAQYLAARRRKILRTVIAQVIFRGFQVAPVGCSFNASGVDCDQFMADVPCAGLGQQLLDDFLRLLIPALAELMMSDMPLRIDKIEGRPILIAESTPYRTVVVDRERIIDPHVLCCPPN